MIIKLHRLAEDELEQAISYYESKTKGLGGDFASELYSLTKRIMLFPQAFFQVERNIRKAILNRFPYVVYYELFNDKIVILTISHHKQHPNRYKKRLADQQ